VNSLPGSPVENAMTTAAAATLHLRFARLCLGAFALACLTLLLAAAWLRFLVPGHGGERLRDAPWLAGVTGSR
jgi:hypothetical protein